MRMRTSRRIGVWRHGPACLVMWGVLGVLGSASAQQAHAPSLDELLRKLEANLDRYDASVPGFFCDEHVVSNVFPATGHPGTVTDSVFRLKRVVQSGGKVALVESRDVKTVNGKPATSHDIDGPTIVNGAFEGGLAVVSESQKACMDYSLERAKRGDPKGVYVVRFNSVLTPQNSAGCLLQEDGKGRAFIDPVSMQTTHVELTTPRHTIAKANYYSSATMGERVLSVDYAPVELGGQTFWMPATISSTVTSGRGTYHSVVWTYTATYKNFHKLEVTSRIIPSGDTP